MPSTDLRIRPFGRKMKPFALAVSLTMAILVWMFADNLAVGTVLDGWQGDVAGVAACFSFVLLTCGWWCQWQHLLRCGLLLSAGVWIAVSSILFSEFGISSPNVLLSFAWVVGSVGAWLLERGLESE